MPFTIDTSNTFGDRAAHMASDVAHAQLQGAARHVREPRLDLHPAMLRRGNDSLYSIGACCAHADALTKTKTAMTKSRLAIAVSLPRTLFTR
jgi:hypothetical protein